MKIKDGFILREVAGSFIVVAVGDRVKEFNGVINLNDTGAFIWKTMEKDVSEEDVVEALKKEYDVSEEVAKDGVNKFITKMKEAKLFQ